MILDLDIALTEMRGFFNHNICFHPAPTHLRSFCFIVRRLVFFDPRAVRDRIRTALSVPGSKLRTGLMGLTHRLLLYLLTAVKILVISQCGNHGGVIEITDPTRCSNWSLVVYVSVREHSLRVRSRLGIYLDAQQAQLARDIEVSSHSNTSLLSPRLLHLLVC